MSKWPATSRHESQSSAVILYMLTRPLTAFAMVGVTLVPGDKEYTTGRLISCQTCIRYIQYPFLTWNHLQTYESPLHIFKLKCHQRSTRKLHTSEAKLISSKSKSSPNTQSCFTVKTQGKNHRGNGRNILLCLPRQVNHQSWSSLVNARRWYT